MNIRWLWFDYVPEGIELTKKQRRFVSERTWREVQRKWFVTLPIAAGFVPLIYWLDSSVAPVYLAARFVAPAGSVIALEIAGWLFARPAVFRAIREVGMNVCPKCGYDLRGQREQRWCPECGWGDEGAS